MPSVVIALKSFFQGWTDSLSRFWLAFSAFITGSSTVLSTLNGTAPVWGTTVITWVVQESKGDAVLKPGVRVTCLSWVVV